MSDRSMEKKKIYVACGDSAGHIFPGLTLAEELTRRYGNDAEISFLTSGSDLARSLLGGTRFDVHALPLHKRGDSMRTNFKFLSGLFKGTLESFKIILSGRPNCFVGFGSYVAGPPFAIASLLGIPTLIHEQNAVMGKANRIMKRFATKVALSFADNELKSKNVVFTGNPIRESAARRRDKTDARHSLGSDSNKFTILIIGGSQGSRTINSATIAMLKNMQEEEKGGIQLIHISGESDYERLKKAYEEVNVSCKLYPFFKDMSIIYSASDMSISRAGASVIYELCAHKIPSILIPYPFAESHQIQNSNFLAHKKAAIVIEESELRAARLLEKVRRLVKEENLRKSMSEKMETLVTFDAAKRLADEVGSLL